MPTKTRAKSGLKKLKDFSIQELRDELDSRERSGVVDSVELTDTDKGIIKNIKLEMIKLDNGLMYPIEINGATFDFLLYWHDADSCTLDYDGTYRAASKSKENELVAEAIDVALREDSWWASDLPNFKVAMKEVNARIAQIMKESDRLAKKYAMDDAKFFNKYILRDM